MLIIFSCNLDIFGYIWIYDLYTKNIMMDRLTKRLDFNFKNSNTIFALINEIDKLNTKLSFDNKLSPQSIKRLTQSIIITSSWASNRIEWNRLTNEEIESLYKEMRIKKFRTRDQQEVAGYIEVLETIFDSYDWMIFNEWLILQLHGMMLKYTDKDQWHRWHYKYWPNRVEARDNKWNLVKVIFNPTEPWLTPIEMQNLVHWTQKNLEESQIHPLIIIWNFIFEFLAIHPFQDGNWRMSRLLTNLLLLQQWYKFMPYISHESLIESRKVDYYVALWKSQQTWKTEKENIFPRIKFFLEIIKNQADQAIKLSDWKDIRLFLTDKQLAVWDYIITKHPCTRKDIVYATGISEATVKQVINKLINMGKIVRIWESRGVKYDIV